MIPRPPVDVTATLTQGELEQPFRLAPPDADPLPAVTRLGLVWDGEACIEVDPTTGRPVASEG